MCHPNFIPETQFRKRIFPMLDLKRFDLSRQILLESLLLSHLDHTLGKHVCDLALN